MNFFKLFEREFKPAMRRSHQTYLSSRPSIPCIVNHSLDSAPASSPSPAPRSRRRRRPRRRAPASPAVAPRLARALPLAPLRGAAAIREIDQRLRILSPVRRRRFPVAAPRARADRRTFAMATARRLNARVVVRRVLSVPDGPFAPRVRARLAPRASIIPASSRVARACGALAGARACVAPSVRARVGLKNRGKASSGDGRTIVPVNHA